MRPWCPRPNRFIFSSKPQLRNGLQEALVVQILRLVPRGSAGQTAVNRRRAEVAVVQISARFGGAPRASLFIWRIVAARAWLIQSHQLSSAAQKPLRDDHIPTR